MTTIEKANEHKLSGEFFPDKCEEYTNHLFCCFSGGSPRNIIDVPEVHRSDKFEYSTVCNGDAYSGEVVILCKNTGTRDIKGRPIYITPSGVVFIFSYSGGSPEYFDSGSLREPSMS